MAEKTTGAVKKAAPLKKSFSVADLTTEQKEAVVADYIGIHPKYYWYRGRSIDVDLYKLSRDGINWTGFTSERNKGK